MTESTNHTTISSDKVRAGFRYFGIVAPGDESKGVKPEHHPVTIDRIKQYQGVTDIVSALHHIPQGKVWTKEEIGKRKIEVEFNDKVKEPEELKGKSQAERDAWYVAEYQRLVEASKTNDRLATGLRWDTVESLSFTEAIKSCDVNNADDCKKRDEHIATFKESLQNLAAFGIHTVVGNFMPVADWTRTGYVTQNNGSLALEYNHAAFTAFDVHILKRHDNAQGYLDDKSYTKRELEDGDKYWKEHLENDQVRRVELTKMIVAGLPGCQGIKATKQFDNLNEEEQWIKEHLLKSYREQVGKYAGWDQKKLQDNIKHFLKEVVPTAKKLGINLCAHPDDPAFTPFMGTPRAVGSEADYKFLIENGCGVNLCTGSLMANPDNRKDITGIITRLAEHGKKHGMSINQTFPHVHLRPVETNGKDFVEGEHDAHIEELRKIAATLLSLGWHGVYRPDHSTTPTYELDGDGKEKPVGNRGYHGAGRSEGLSALVGLFGGLEKYFDRKAIRAQIARSGKHHEDVIDGLVKERIKDNLDLVMETSHVRDREKPSNWAAPDAKAVAQHAEIPSVAAG